MTPRQVVEAWIDAFNRADAETLAALYAEDAVNHQVMWEPLVGRAAIRAMFEREFGHAQMVCIRENLFEDGDWAILEWRDPKGLRGCGFFQVRDGRIAFQRGYWDEGDLPPPAGTAVSYGPGEFQRDLGLDVSRETLARLETHRRLLADWSGRMNLIGPRELEHYWSRHALDSAQLLRLAPGAKRWVDLGSGAGFPGIVIACLLADVPGAEVHLVESTGKKARFLEEVIRDAKLPATVFNVRIEDFGPGQGRYDVVTARALAPLPRLIAYAKPILDRGAQGLFHKGADTDAELAAAKDALIGGAYRADVLESLSDPRGRIVRITKAA